MGKYWVAVPIAGAIHVEVEAENEKDAKKFAIDRLSMEGAEAGDVEWEFFKRLTTGNVLHAPYNEISVYGSKE
jgi:hypothetical protein